VEQVGYVTWVNGPVVRAKVSGNMQMMEQVEVGDYHLIGEVISMTEDTATLQVYEETAFDGIQRPLELLAAQSGDFIERGVTAPALARDHRWQFQPTVEANANVYGGEIIGTVPETALVEHRVMVPPDLSGILTWIAPTGEYTVTDPIARISTPDGEREVTMLQRWAVRRERPIRERLNPSEPLVTGQRVVDILFPIPKGGTAAIPGGFGTGKTVLQQALAKWSDADIVIYVGCGERGNEMTDVLIEFPQLQDPKTGRSLIERTILIANTSNMPVAAREASIYTGVTLAEYYRRGTARDLGPPGRDAR